VGRLMSYIPDFSKKKIEGRSGDDLQEKKKGDETQRENEKYPTQSTSVIASPIRARERLAHLPRQNRHSPSLPPHFGCARLQQPNLMTVDAWSLFLTHHQEHFHPFPPLLHEVPPALLLFPFRPGWFDLQTCALQQLELLSSLGVGLGWLQRTVSWSVPGHDPTRFECHAAAVALHVTCFAGPCCHASLSMRTLTYFPSCAWDCTRRASQLSHHGRCNTCCIISLSSANRKGLNAKTFGLTESFTKEEQLDAERRTVAAPWQRANNHLQIAQKAEHEHRQL